MENSFIVDYNRSLLKLTYNGEKFVWDLTESGGDISDFWHYFVMRDGTTKDMNFFQYAPTDVPAINVYNTMIDECGRLTLDTSTAELITYSESIGNAETFFNNYYNQTK